MQENVGLEGREMLPLLVVKAGTGSDGWFHDDILLGTTLFLLQERAPKYLQSLTNTRHPFTFVRKPFGPDSTDLNQVLSSLIQRGFLEARPFPVTSDGTVYETALRATDSAKSVLTKVLQHASKTTEGRITHAVELSRAAGEILRLAQRFAERTPYRLEREAVRRLGRAHSGVSR